MPFYERGNVRIYFEEAGTGFPLLVIPGGGLNSAISLWSAGNPISAPFNAMAEFKDDFRCISMDQRNANLGQSSGPVEVDDPWGAYAHDQLGLMDHLGIQRFLALGNCVAGPFILKLMETAPDRVVAGVFCQPSGYSPDHPNLFWDANLASWGPQLCARRDDVTMEMVEAHLYGLYRVRPDFVFSVEREFVRSCRTPMFILPDNHPSHPFQVAMDIFKLAPNAEVSHFPWKEPEVALAAAIERIREFLRVHRPASVTDALITTDLNSSSRRRVDHQPKGYGRA